jgi:hypothetical protein
LNQRAARSICASALLRIESSPACQPFFTLMMMNAQIAMNSQIT